MAKKKAKAKAKKRVEIKLPVPHDCEFPHDEVVVIPTPVVPAEVEHLPEVVELTHCEVTLVDTLIVDNYLWLKVPADCDIFDQMTPGQTIKCDVRFSPPSQ